MTPAKGPGRGLVCNFHNHLKDLDHRNEAIDPTKSQTRIVDNIPALFPIINISFNLQYCICPI